MMHQPDPMNCKIINVVQDLEVTETILKSSQSDNNTKLISYEMLIGWNKPGAMPGFQDMYFDEETLEMNLDRKIEVKLQKGASLADLHSRLFGLLRLGKNDFILFYEVKFNGEDNNKEAKINKHSVSFKSEQ
jgi:hypothetical protein